MKNIFIQQIRGILIVLVIMIHSISVSSINAENYLLIFLRTICNMAVPIFLFLSGYFFNVKKNNDSNEYIKKKIKRLLLPLLIWNIVYFIISYNYEFKNLFLFTSAPHLYFIVVLIQLIMLTPLIIKHKNIKLLLCLVTPFYLIIYRLTWMITGDTIIPLHQYYFFAWSIYYVFGIVLQEKIKLFKINKIHLLLLFVITLIYNYVIYNLLSFNYAVSQMNIINMLFSLCVCLYLVNNIKEDSKINILSKIGDISFGVYFIHIFVLKVLSRILSIFINNTVLLTFSKCILTIIISYILIKIFSSVTNKKYDKLLGF